MKPEESVLLFWAKSGELVYLKHYVRVTKRQEQLTDVQYDDDMMFKILGENEERGGQIKKGQTAYLMVPKQMF